MTLPPNVHDAEPIPEAAREAIDALMQSGDLFRYTAPQDAPVALLEAEFAELLGSKYALAVSSCSAALFLSLKALGLPRDARVLIPGFTFAAVPSSVVHADCVPVLLAAPGAVGVAHAGWRGIAAGVVPATVHALVALAGCDPAAVTACIGPHIGVRAYETGDVVVDALVAAGLPRAEVAWEGPDRLHADLGRAVEFQLQGAGVGTVERLHRCTATEPAFYSHRRDGPATGRLAGLVGLDP